MLTKYQSIFDTTIDGIIVINKRGFIEDVNHAALKLFGYDKNELIGQNVNVLMPEPDKSRHDGYIKNYQTTRKPKIIGIGREVHGRKKDGSSFPFSLAVSEFEVDNEQFFTGVIHDLSQRKLQEQIIKGYAEELEQRVEQRTTELKKEIELRETAQKALIESQRLYETIAKNFPNGTISVLDPSFNTIFLEGRELEKLGHSAADLLTKNYLENIPAQWQEKVKEKLDKVLQGEEVEYTYGEQDRVYKVRGVPLSTERGRVNQLLVVENNNSEQQKAEKEMYAALKKEKELNELKTKFVSMASHEFRTPLSSILSSAALAGKYTGEEHQDNRLRHLQKIKTNVQNLTMILNDFLSLERIEGGFVQYKPVQLDIVDFLKNAMEEATPLLKVDQQIRLETKTDEHICGYDAFLLKNTLINIISNAIKYSDKEIVISLTVGNGTEIAIIDQGIGISEEDQKYLFTRFFRAGNAGQIQGTGLGLNIVERYVKLMNGAIIFESQLGSGSTFTIQLNDGDK